jgi:hypothetical protein
LKEKVKEYQCSERSVKMREKSNNIEKGNQRDEVKAYQETNEEISNNESLKNSQPTPQPKDFDEIEY